MRSLFARFAMLGIAGSALVSTWGCSASTDDVGSAEAAVTTGTVTATRCFEETGQEIGDGVSATSPSAEIGAYWRANGGLRLLGLPLSPVLPGTSTTGEAIRVQWFERARLEYQPSLAAQHKAGYGNGVLEGLLGVEYLKSIGLVDGDGKPLFQCGVSSPHHSIDQTEYHAETGCTIFGLDTHPQVIALNDAKPLEVDAQPNFLDYYRRNGGLQHFGHPISEVMDLESISDECELDLQRAHGKIEKLSDACKVIAADGQVKPYRLAPLTEVDPDAGFGDVNVAAPNTAKYVQYFERGRLEYQPANIHVSEATKRAYAGRVYYVGSESPADDYTVQVGLFGAALAPHGASSGDRTFQGWPRSCP